MRRRQAEEISEDEISGEEEELEAESGKGRGVKEGMRNREREHSTDEL